MSFNLYKCPSDGCDTYMPLLKLERHYNSTHKDSLPDMDELTVLDQSDKSDNQSDKTGNNPIMGSDESDPTTDMDEPNSDDNSESDPDPKCPDCSGEVVDFRAYTPGEVHTIDGTTVFVRGEYWCIDCGGWYANE